MTVQIFSFGLICVDLISSPRIHFYLEEVVHNVIISKTFIKVACAATQYTPGLISHSLHPQALKDTRLQDLGSVPDM